MQTTVAGPVRLAVPEPLSAVRRSLDDLAALDSNALEGMFAAGTALRLHELHGHPRGRVLAIPQRDAGATAAVLRFVHAQAWWPWEGKSFHSQPGVPEGVGINRLRGPLRRGVFPFRTYENASAIDGQPCIAIDYEIPRNPRAAHSIYDEVRRVGEGLYLGRGMRRRAGGPPRLVLWFGLDTRIADRPVAFRDVG
jgi:hypothetical protein